jgi:CRP-like cAMP-binding protein/phosphoribosyl 1,2-cyclic phosphodiesterase
MEGTKVVNTSEGGILFRCPSEILKVLKEQKIAIPSIIVLPERDFEYGINQSSLEFPLYNSLFGQSGVSQRRKLVIVCNDQKQVERNREILRLTLLGSFRKEIGEWKISEAEINYWTKVCKYFAPAITDIDEAVDFRVFPEERGEIEIGKVRIYREDKDVFKIVDEGEEVLVDINLNDRQKPPIPIFIPNQPIQRPIFGVLALSKCTTGFDLSGYTSGLILWLNSFGVSIDGVAWMKEHLYSMGINPKEIKAHLITHIHSDHSELLDLIIGGKRVTVMSSKLIGKMFFKKIALILNISMEQIEEMVDFVELIPGKKISWYGTEFRCWNTVHSIPTIGIRVSLGGKSIVYTGDTLWGKEELGKLEKRRVISRQKKDETMEIPHLSSDLIFCDAGDGMIHSKPERLAELSERIRKRLIPIHLEKLPKKLGGVLNSPPRPGQEWVIIPQVLEVSDFLTIRNASLLQDIDPNWINVFFSQGKVRQYPQGKIILKQGELSKNFYLILSGTVETVIDGELVTYLSSGDFFGDISLLEGIPHTATLRTLTSIRVKELSKKLFLEFCHSTGINEQLRWIYHFRPALMKIDIFRGLPADKINWIALNTLEQEFKAGEVIVRQGELGNAFYFTLKGEEYVEVNTGYSIKRVAQLFPRQYFGEVALLGDGIRTATIRCATSCKVGIIREDFFKKILREIPSVRYELERIAIKRKEDTAKKLNKK